MPKFLLTVCVFGLLLSSASAEEKSPEQLLEERSGIEGLESQTLTRVVFASGAKHESASTLTSTPIALPLVISTSVSPNNQNTARWKL